MEDAAFRESKCFVFIFQTLNLNQNVNKNFTTPLSDFIAGQIISFEMQFHFIHFIIYEYEQFYARSLKPNYAKKARGFFNKKIVFEGQVFFKPDVIKTSC